ncbi:MAG TPA: hypothetical protein VLA56_07120 [Pseudomonadales bacterium]|nr:hypothetical protein [Pseudomonadales bacterium]
MTRPAPLLLCAATILAFAAALPSTGVRAADARQGMAGCIDALPRDIELDLALKGHVNTGAEGPRFRGELTIDDGRDEDGPPPAYLPDLIACMQNVVHGEQAAPRERAPNSVLIF